MNILFPIASLGVINGLIVGIHLLTKKKKSIADVYFVGIIVMLCVRIGKSVIIHYTNDSSSLLRQIGLSACIFIGPFFYLYLKALKENAKKFLKHDLVLLASVFIFIVTIGLLFPYQKYPAYWNPKIVQIIYAVWGFFLILALRIAYQLLGLRWLTPWKLKGNQQYLASILIAVLSITLTYQAALFITTFTYIWGAFIFSLSFYALGYRALKNKSIAAKPIPKQLADANEVLSRLDTLMKEEKLFAEQSLKLDDLAKRLNVSRQNLSQLLNQENINGYSNYIRGYRIAEAQALILSKPQLSLEGIGYEAGFRSKSAFFDAFKKATHQTPAEYKKTMTQK